MKISLAICICCVVFGLACSDDVANTALPGAASSLPARGTTLTVVNETDAALHLVCWLGSGSIHWFADETAAYNSGYKRLVPGLQAGASVTLSVQPGTSAIGFNFSIATNMFRTASLVTVAAGDNATFRLQNTTPVAQLTAARGLKNDIAPGRNLERTRAQIRARTP